jgi:diguanylate cyclase (GGDEF)-like protein
MVMFASMRLRIYAFSGLFFTMLLAVAILLLDSSHRARESFRWVEHTQQVIMRLDGMLVNLREAESGLRGYLLTRSPGYLGPFTQDLRDSRRLAGEVRRLTSDNSVQKLRAERLEKLVIRRTDMMLRVFSLFRPGAPTPVMNPAARARGKALMDELNGLTAEMRVAERALLQVRTHEAEARAMRARDLVLFGWPMLGLLLAWMTWFILTSITRPLHDLMNAVERFANGDRTARASTRATSVEFKRLTQAYNQMADGLVVAMAEQEATEAKLALANADLTERSAALERRSVSIGLLSGMAHRLQAIQGEGELAEVLELFLPKIFPRLAGALYLHNHSRNLLVRHVGWGNPRSTPEMFAPTACWGLRRGHGHTLERPDADMACAHARTTQAFVPSHCEPMLAAGEVLGLLYIEGTLDPEDHFRLGMLAENVALALVNENLRDRLRQQSIRDPLTNLFNRRYMEEAFALEVSRSQRGGTNLSVIMADVDYFKRFNDAFGHEAGDVLLREVAKLINTAFRGGDIVCRYGGEEFIVIAPGADAMLAARRSEALRVAVEQLVVEYQGKPLGQVTMSFGVACSDGERLDSLIGAADRALFSAKRGGRNRIQVARNDVPLSQAAE